MTHGWTQKERQTSLNMGNMEGGQPGSVWELALNVNAAKGKAVQKKNIKYLIYKMPHRVPPKCKAGKVEVKRGRRITYARGNTTKGKKNLTNLRKPQKPIKSKLLESYAIK